MACCLLHNFIRKEMPNYSYDVVQPTEEANGDPKTPLKLHMSGLRRETTADI